MRKNEQHLKKELHPRPSMPFFESSLVFLRAKLQWTSLHIKHSSLPKTRNIVEKEKQKTKNASTRNKLFICFRFWQERLILEWLDMFNVCVCFPFQNGNRTPPRRSRDATRKNWKVRRWIDLQAVSLYLFKKRFFQRHTGTIKAIQ